MELWDANIHDLPVEVRRIFEIIRRCDVASFNATRRLDEAVHSLLGTKHEGKADQCRSTIEREKKLIESLSKEKVALTSHCSTLIDNKLLLLDLESKRSDLELASFSSPGMAALLLPSRRESVADEVEEADGLVASSLANAMLYCTCEKPSFGEMIACDNPDCFREWFHLACVNLRKVPEGAWLCPTCRPSGLTGLREQ